MKDADATYKAGSVVTVTFAGTNPTNNLRTQGSFLEIQRINGSGDKVIVADDGDWETRMSVEKHTVDLVMKARTWTISWFIPDTVEPGQYRVDVFGTVYDDPIIGKATLKDFTGSSRVFTVTA